MTYTNVTSSRELDRVGTGHVSVEGDGIVGGRGAQRRRAPSGLLAKDAVELGVAAEAGLERGGQGRRAPAAPVEVEEALESLLVAEPADRHAGLRFEDPAQVRAAQAGCAREGREVTRVRVGSQHASDGLDRRMQIDPFDDVVAVEERPPGEAQQVRQADVDESLVHRLRVMDLVEERAEPADPGRVQTARELPHGIRLQQGSRVRSRRGTGDETRPEHRPPELVVGGLVDQHVVLAREQPGQRARGERIAPVAEQIGRRAPHDEVDLELGMAMGAGPNVADRVPHHPSLQAGPDSKVTHHRKKR